MSVNIITGNALAELRKLPSDFVSCAITSPPFWGLRDYNTATWEGGDPACDHKRHPTTSTAGEKVDGYASPFRGDPNYADHINEPYLTFDGLSCRRCGARCIDDQIGLEATPAEFVGKLVEVFREVRRVLHPSGTLWVDMGDTYCSRGGARTYGTSDYEKGRGPPPNGRVPVAAKPKDLMMIPAQLAIALRDDGWCLRDEIIWHKKSPMPTSQRDRCTRAHELVYMLTKSATYFYDQKAIAEGSAYPDDKRRPLGSEGAWQLDGRERGANGGGRPYDHETATRIKRSVWTIGRDGDAGAKHKHFATFPRRLVEPMILAGSSERGVCPKCFAPIERVVARRKLKRERLNDLTARTGEAGTGNHCPNTTAGVELIDTGWRPTCACGLEPIPAVILDPFSGLATVGLVAVQLGRSYIGIELNEKYAEASRARINNRGGVPGVKPLQGQQELFP